MTEARTRAENAQANAADPAASAWVEASAGSGKTKLLTDRVLRLLLAGVAPGRILCLTFTKAAAAEMATRLAKRLGEWAVADDATLTKALTKLTGMPPGRETLGAARRLFVEVLEQPGGMRISTLHAFAQSLLRAFPLEAGLAPQFAVVQDQDSRALLAREREAVLAEGIDRKALQTLARLVAPTRFSDLIGTLANARVKLITALDQRQGAARLGGALARKLGLRPGAADEAELLADITAPPEEQALYQAAKALMAGGPNDIKLGQPMAAWLKSDAAARGENYPDWKGIFFTDKGEIRKSFATKAMGAAQGRIQALMEDEAGRIRDLDEKYAAARLLAATMALLAIGEPVLRRYQSAKERAGLLDYDDLIAGARKLLDNPGSAWVLFKLDEGLDHILLDEAQDSNPEQWGIVRALAGEFFAGLGARDAPRSIFAVGDQKQSIYGFQGADAAGFGREKDYYHTVVTAARQDFRPVALDVSFRSTEPVLALVDAVFADAPAREGVTAADAKLRHFADRAGQAGSVEIWPLVQLDKAPAPPDWAPPDQAIDAEGAAPRLAAVIAARIAQMITQETLPSRVEKGREDAQPQGRPIRPGDILVLLRARKRGGFAQSLVRELKALRIPVGGIDRMVLIEELAVQDMLALAQWLLLPDDDLNLAALLKSPLIGLDDDTLFTLAHGRHGSLTAAIMAHHGAASDTGRAAEWLAGQAARVDYITPHGLFASVLGQPGPLDRRAGRARILERLGPDAGDPLDELLNAALEYERLHPPSLEGFVQWLRQGGAEVKREAEAAGNAVRIMTVHGAKGLQAPIVILPDTTGKAPDRDTLRWLEQGEDRLPAWSPKLEGFKAPALMQQRQADEAREAAEAHRLLYVALTRAEDQLIICGWQGAKAPPKGCWYDLVDQGFARLAGAESLPFSPAAFGVAADAFGAGMALRRLSVAQNAVPRLEETAGASAAASKPPAWAWRPAASEAAAGSISPSALPGEEETPAAAPRPAADPLGLRFRRGRLVHALLQTLPDHPAALREYVARRFLARRAPGLDAAEQEATLAEVLELLQQDWLIKALGPGSLAEAPLAGEIGGRLIAGQVDQLKIEADRVLVLDYKTNRPPPENVADVAPLYLRQMAAYRALLRAAFPGRVVECALVWTYGARMMRLPDALLDQHQPQAAG